MPTLILDPEWEQILKAARDARNPYSRDEVWDGVLVVPPNANNEHQQIVMDLAYAFCSVVNRGGGDHVLPGANVSDRDQDWMQNYRDPDVVVYLATNPAKDSNTHWVGGPDLLVEITSPGDDPRQKLRFYAKVNTREVLIVDRDPWGLELYHLQAKALTSVGRTDPANPAVLTSSVLPLTFQLVAGTSRPTILVTHTQSGQTWTA